MDEYEFNKAFAIFAVVVMAVVGLYGLIFWEPAPERLELDRAFQSSGINYDTLHPVMETSQPIKMFDQGVAFEPKNSSADQSFQWFERDDRIPEESLHGPLLCLESPFCFFPVGGRLSDYQGGEDAKPPQPMKSLEVLRNDIHYKDGVKLSGFIYYAYPNNKSFQTLATAEDIAENRPMTVILWGHTERVSYPAMVSQRSMDLEDLWISPERFRSKFGTTVTFDYAIIYVFKWPSKVPIGTYSIEFLSLQEGGWAAIARWIKKASEE